MSFDVSTEEEEEEDQDCLCTDRLPTIIKMLNIQEKQMHGYGYISGMPNRANKKKAHGFGWKNENTTDIFLMLKSKISVLSKVDKMKKQ